MPTSEMSVKEAIGILTASIFFSKEFGEVLSKNIDESAGNIEKLRCEATKIVLQELWRLQT